MLEKISITLPGAHPECHERLLEMLAPLGKSGPRRIAFTPSDPAYFPRLFLAFPARCDDASAEFHLSDAKLSIRIENSTGAEKRNPLPYRPLPVDAVARRMSEEGWRILCADHIGFNLPWFGPGLHPRILELRRKLAASCLYHRYPSGEPWDFILPGGPKEITRRKVLDYFLTRRPKCELVSFAGSSTPLIQIDVGVNACFEDVRPIFPEALSVPSLRQNWLYLENPYALDICLVIGEHADGDWSHFFAGHRLIQENGGGRKNG